jgi:hypothetical protein
MKKPHFYQTKAQKKARNKRKNTYEHHGDRLLKLLDEGIHPLLNVCGHDVRQRLLFCLLHHQLRRASPSCGGNAKEAAGRKATGV